MAYQVDRYNGQFLVSVEDGTIDTSTELRFVGKNYAGYGEVQNENFLHLMENFASTNPPPKAVTGQIWYDSANKKLKFYDGSKFKFANGAEAAATAPSGLGIGEFWWDTSAKQLYAWTGTEFTLIGPEAAPDLGASQVVPDVVKDTDNQNNTVIKFIASGKVVAIVSETEFTPLIAIEDFPRVKKGITLVRTDSNGVTTDNHFFWGTASNANLLGGKPASDYLLRGQNEFDQTVRFYDPGFVLGGIARPDTPDLKVSVEGGDNVVFENQLGNNITFKITVTDSIDERNVAVLTPTGIMPGTSGTISGFNLGSEIARWVQVHSQDFYGDITGDVVGDVTGDLTGDVFSLDATKMINGATKEIGYVGATLRGTLFGNVEGSLTGTASNATLLNFLSPSVALPGDADKTSVAVRNSDGDITARKFLGTADKADQLLVGALYRSTSLAADANTIVSRDGSADITANLFKGTATAARYADLAEKYLADKEYEPGTVVSIGGEFEVTACQWGERALGVVSTNPAFMMNKDLEGGIYIALKGRVPVKVLGAVKKGQRLIAGNNGCAVAAVPHANDVFAIALESNDNVGEKIIEAVVL